MRSALIPAEASGQNRSGYWVGFGAKMGIWNDFAQDSGEWTSWPTSPKFQKSRTTNGRGDDADNVSLHGVLANGCL